MTNPKQKGIIFLTKVGFNYYDQGSNRIILFTWPINIVKDLDIIDPEEMDKQIKIFISANKLNPTNLLFIVSTNVLFDRIFPESAKKTEEIQSFLDNVPFEKIISKEFVLNKSTRIIAFNQDLFSVLKKTFETADWSVVGVIPDFILGSAYAARQNLDTDIIKIILSKFEDLKQQTLVSEPKNNILLTNLGPTGENQPRQQAKKIPRSLYPMLGISIVLIIILIIMVISQFRQKPKVSPVPQTIVAPPTEPSATPTIEIQPTVSSPSATPTESNP